MPLAVVEVVGVGRDVALHGDRAKGIAVADALPVGRGLRRAPAQLAHRGRGKGDALKGCNAGVGCGQAANQAVFGLCNAKHRSNLQFHNIKEIILYFSGIVKHGCSKTHKDRPYQRTWSQGMVA